LKKKATKTRHRAAKSGQHVCVFTFGSGIRTRRLTVPLGERNALAVAREFKASMDFAFVSTKHVGSLGVSHF
jgi:hypothetical protein